MAMRKVEAFGNVGDDLLPGCHLTFTHCVQCVAGPRARKWFGAAAPWEKEGIINVVFVLFACVFLGWNVSVFGFVRMC